MVARVSASPVTSASTKGMPTEASTGWCALVTTSDGARPAQAAIASAGSSISVDSGCGAAITAPVTAPAASRSTRTSTRPDSSSNSSTPSRSSPCRARTQPVPTLGWPAKGIS